MKKEILAGLIAAGIGFILIFLAQNYPEISLYPHKIFLTFFLGHQFELLPKEGFRQIQGLYILGKSCIGIKLFSCLLILLGVYKVRWNRSFFFILLWIPAALILSFGATLSRILFSMPFVYSTRFVLIHNILSLIIYFFTCYIFYGLLEKRRLSHEKTGQLS